MTKISVINIFITIIFYTFFCPVFGEQHKPITFERFQVAAERVKTILSSQAATGGKDFIFVKSNGKQVKIEFTEIIFIQSNGDYITIHTTDKKITIYERMKKIISQLPDNQFIRIRNSYIVNINKVEVLHKEKLKIAETELPISEKYRNVVKNIFAMK